MDGRKKMGSSSLSSELFGSKENGSPSSSSTGIFKSIFAPPSKVLGRESMQQDTVTSGWNNRTSKPGDVIEGNIEEQENLYNQDQRVQPCHLSSSIYYGGPDVYFQPQNSTINSTTTNKKKGDDDDSGSASRGNWWQGSLYY